MKMLKNSGQVYKQYRGRGAEVPARNLGSACTCKNRCFEKIPDEDKTEIFTKFWNQGNYDIQNAYLQGSVRKLKIKRKTKQVDTRRTATIEYSIQLTNTTIKVCKTAFISLHGLSRGRLEYIVSKLKVGETIPQSDRRGKHQNHKRKYTQDVVDNVHSFIGKLPRYQSHYSRNRNLAKEYMSLEYNIELLYNRYKECCQEAKSDFVSSDKFRRIFTEDYNIAFKPPKSDTCAHCDELVVKINHAKEIGETETVRKLEFEKELHLRKAEKARDLFKKATEESTTNPDVHVITFDLQQALPTPKLTTGPCFYKKKIMVLQL